MLDVFVVLPLELIHRIKTLLLQNGKEAILHLLVNALLLLLVQVVEALKQADRFYFRHKGLLHPRHAVRATVVTGLPHVGAVAATGRLEDLRLL